MRERSVVYGFAYSARLAEIHGRAFYLAYFTRRHVCRVGRSIVVGVDIQHHVHCLFRRVAVQVEVAVVGHVYHGLLVSSRIECYVERVVSRQSVCGRSLHSARKTVVAVG